MHRRRASSANALQRSEEAVLKELQICLQATASRHDGPAEPLHLKAALWMEDQLFPQR